MRSDPSWEPSEQEIKEACERLQSSWDSTTEASRRGEKRAHIKDEYAPRIIAVDPRLLDDCGDSRTTKD